MKNNVLKKICIIVIIYITVNYINIYASSYIYKNTLNDSSNISVSVKDPVFNFQSKSQVLIEPTTGKIIYANNENEKIYPASTTKIMTLLLLMENIDSGKIKYEDKITCSTNASSLGGSQIWFKENETLTIDEVLKAICIVSANDVTVAIAEHIGGSEENFVKMMNEKAKLLDMNNTNFVNSHGLHDENHYTTAMDIAIMSKELILNHPNIFKYTSIWMDSLRDGTFGLSNTNKLIKYYEGGIGLKTGYTPQSLYNLSGVAKRDNTIFLSIITGAPSSDIRLAETKQLLDFGFNNYNVENIIAKDSVIDSKMFNKNITDEFNIVLKEDISILKEKGSNTEYNKIIEYNDNIILPLKKEDIIGKVKIYDKESNIISEKDMYVNKNVDKSKYIDYLKHIISKMF